MNIELTAIEAALQYPFPCDMVHFKPVDANLNPATKRWECRVLPYADIHTYEDRLNDLAFGHWSTPYTSVASTEAQKVSASPVPQPHPAISRSSAPKGPTPDQVDATLLASIQRDITEKQKSQALRYYNIADLAHLTAAQAIELSQFIEERKRQKKTVPAGVSR